MLADSSAKLLPRWANSARRRLPSPIILGMRVGSQTEGRSIYYYK
jgi:hypothetical protein